MRAIISPAPLKGSIGAIPSKSQAHRMLICAAFAEGETEIICPSLSADIRATADCLRALGADIEYGGGAFRVRPIESPVEGAELCCGESGSTLRFLLPVVCALGVKASLKMEGRLPQRPLSPMWEELERHGCRLSRPRQDIIAVEGALRPGDYELAADVSSQFISGFLFAMPLLGEACSLRLTGKTESAGYIDMTLRALKAFGVEPEWGGDKFTLSGEEKYRSCGRARVEGDWSNAAFWIVASRLGGGEPRCTGLEPDSPQGDRAVLELTDRIASGNAVVDAGNVPDLIPVLSVLAALSPGRTEFINAGRLRIKESDRLRAVSNMLQALGGCVEEKPEGLVVHGVDSLSGGVVDSVNDHRIAMSAAVAAIACKGSVTVLDAQAVNKSYPAFWQDYASLGGNVRLED